MSQGALSATVLRCERQVAPIEVGTDRPAFSWIPVTEGRAETQTGYRILVATDPGLLTDGRPDLWDSGRVDSGAVAGIPYAGRPLESRLRCWWSVQLWDRAGNPGPVSDPAPFELGLLDAEDWVASWIGDGVTETSPLLRREFEIPGDILRARAYVTGLGYYELRLNGAKVGDRVLDPAQTSYDHDPNLRDAHGANVRIHSPRVIYAVFDVTAQLRPGANAVGLMLGDGWYSPPAGHPLARRWGDRPRGLVQLEIELEDGRRVVVSSDESWGVDAGPIVAASPIDGEHFDARREPAGWDDAGFVGDWPAAALLPAPAGVLATTTMEPIRVVETLDPVEVVELRESVRIVDFGQHISGWTRIRITAPAGARVTLRHAGDVDETGELDDSANVYLRTMPSARQTDDYVSAGGTSEWEPRFTLHGFRYVEVTTTAGVQIDRIDARVVHSDVARTGSFECSDDLLNRIDRNVDWTLRASLQGYPQDAADRGERHGWLGDSGFVIEDYFYGLETTAFWAKWLDDIRDTQLPDGAVPVVAPIHAPGREYGWIDSYSDLPDWGETYAEIAWQLYEFSGDLTILDRHYEGLRSLLDWFSGFAADGVVTAGLGDHGEPQSNGLALGTPDGTPVALTSTAWWYRTADIVASSAELLAKPEASSLRALAESIKASFARAFYDPATGQYATGSQTSLAMPLWLGLVPDEQRERVGANLVARITGPDRSHLTTGAMGTAALEHVLADVGGADAMYDIATQLDYPSWGDQIRQGATTVWEAWGGVSGVGDDPAVFGLDFDVDRIQTSRNMKLMCAVTRFLYADVAGIAPAAPGWARIQVRPALTHRLTRGRARVVTAHGDAAISWTRDAERLEVELTVPATSVAEVVLPVRGLADPVLREGDRTLWAGGRAGDAADGVSGVHRDGDDLRFELGGGRYRFTVASAS
jgi:alpha-L-rhamnosidase